MTGYDAVMQVAAREDADLWLPIARSCHDLVMRFATRTGEAPSEVEFSPEGVESKRVTTFSWVRGWRREDPGLTPLCDGAVLERQADGFLRMPDPDGVGRALDELQVRVKYTWRREISGEAP